jgi:hypothetical protein
MLALIVRLVRMRRYYFLCPQFQHQNGRHVGSSYQASTQAFFANIGAVDNNCGHQLWAQVERMLSSCTNCVFKLTMSSGELHFLISKILKSYRE